jgi:hypothetical protein
VCSRVTAAKLITGWCAGVLAIQSCSAHLGPGTHCIDQDVPRSTDLHCWYYGVSWRSTPRLLQVMNALILFHLFKSSAIHREQAYPLPLDPELLPILGIVLSIEANEPCLIVCWMRFMSKSLVYRSVQVGDSVISRGDTHLQRTSHAFIRTHLVQLQPLKHRQVSTPKDSSS